MNTNNNSDIQDFNDRDAQNAIYAGNQNTPSIPEACAAPSYAVDAQDSVLQNSTTYDNACCPVPIATFTGVSCLNEAPMRGTAIKKLRLISYSELIEKEIEKTEFIVDKIMPRRGITLITGEGGIGKSWITIELAYSIATGTNFLSHFSCAQGPVVMLDLENDQDIISVRLKQITKGKHVDDTIADPELPIFVVEQQDTVGFSIMDMSSQKLLHDALREIRPVLLVIDPLVALHYGDENCNTGMRALFDVLRQLTIEFNMAVVVLHHIRKGYGNSRNGVRGAGDIVNAVDSHLSISKVSGDLLTIKHDKSRTCKEHPDFYITKPTDDESGEKTTIKYTEPDASIAPKVSKEETAKVLIVGLLEDGSIFNRKEIIASLERSNIAKTTVTAALKVLTREKIIEQPCHGRYQICEEE